MKKKLIDLTDEELSSLCKKYRDCTREAGKVNCPLWLGRCLKGVIQMNRYLQNSISMKELE